MDDIDENQVFHKGCVYLLSILANKGKWYGKDNLYPKRGTLNHILTGCKTALAQGRYTWS